MMQEGAAGPAATATRGVMFLVSACWADECEKRLPNGQPVAFEGQEFESLKGNKFRVFSSVDKAITEPLAEPKVIYVCPGTYRERRWWQFWRR